MFFRLTGELLNLTPLDANGRQMTRPRRRFSLREGNRAVRPTDRRSKMISAPTNFNHISHMGPGNGIQVSNQMNVPYIRASQYSILINIHLIYYICFIYRFSVY